MDFLATHIVSLNPDRGKLAFLEAVDTDRAGKPVKVRFEGSLPWVTGHLTAWGKERFLIDTGWVGFGTCSIRKTLYKVLCENKTVVSLGQGTYESASGRFRIREGRIGLLTLDGYEHHNLACDKCDTNILGLNLWLRYNVTFDFPNQKAYLLPSGRFDDEDVRDLSGLHLLKIDGEIVVDSIEEGSPAALSGTHPNDVVIQLAGMKANQTRLYVLRKVLATGGQAVAIRLKRGDNVLTVSLLLSESWTGAPPDPPR